MRIPRWLQIAVTLAILAVVLWRIPLQELIEAARSADRLWFLPALGATLAMLFVRYLKWHRLLRAAGLAVSETDSLRSLLCGFALSVPTPGRVGELGRCLFLPQKMRSEVLQLNILERVLDGWAVFTYCVLSLAIVAFRPYGIFAIAVWLALLPVFLGLSALLSAIGQWRVWQPGLRARLSAGSAALANVRSAPFAGLALVTTTLDLGIFYFLLQALHRIDLFTVAISFPWMIMAGGLPIAAGGIGPREGVAAYLLAKQAVPAAAAVDAALLLFVFTAIFPAIAGGVWMLARRLRRHAGVRIKMERAVRVADEEI
ncbi:MAG TPA: lysylphosphatidylglycerol synthase transmembrane domain-containing protein [Terriglobia bacterium]|nr:lysylphosphatidylglycerol synthase transmembrane domain-containing protein [Terriglobia bacterium]